MKRRHMEVCPISWTLGWKLTLDKRVLDRFAVQEDAIAAAMQAAHAIADAGGLVTLKIKRRDGTIRDERTYPRSSDPRRTRG